MKRPLMGKRKRDYTKDHRGWFTMYILEGIAWIAMLFR